MTQRLLLSLAVGTLPLLSASTSVADDTIKNPGDHPQYHVEAEPHLVLAYDNIFGTEGIGIGGRFTIPLLDYGFIPSINNSVGIGFGLDIVHYSGFCHYRDLICDATYAFIPVVMQWNFFVAQQWSVFGEPGLAFWHGFGIDACPAGNNCNFNERDNGFFPFVIFVGGRYHFNEDVSLTMRIGWPMITVGVSFFP